MAEKKKPAFTHMRWSEADDKLLRELIERGANGTAISQTLGRTRSSIFNRKFVLGIEQAMNKTKKGQTNDLTFGTKTRSTEPQPAPVMEVKQAPAPTPATTKAKKEPKAEPKTKTEPKGEAEPKRKAAADDDEVPKSKIHKAMPALPKDGSSPKPVKYWGGIIYTAAKAKKFRALKERGNPYTEASASWGGDKPTTEAWTKCVKAIEKHHQK